MIRTRMRAFRQGAAVLGIAALAAGGIAAATAPAPALELVETPFFADRVSAGELPPVAERVPAQPSVVVLLGDRTMGRHGGELRMLIGRPRDVRLMVVYGYARLVGYTDRFETVPDILQSIEVEDERIFTLYLRKGHKWSDGAPFTSEDFRYWWRMSPTIPTFRRQVRRSIC